MPLYHYSNLFKFKLSTNSLQASLLLQLSKEHLFSVTSTPKYISSLLLQLPRNISSTSTPKEHLFYFNSQRTSLLLQLSKEHLFYIRIIKERHQDSKDMATEQEFNDIILYKTGSVKYRSGLSDNEKRNIRDKASSYVAEQGLLYIQDKDKKTDLIRKRRVIIKSEEKEKILSMCHDGIDLRHALWKG